MISPNYMCFTSLMDNKIRIMGNVEYANKIAEMTKKYLRQGLNLYDTQEKIRNHIFEKLGVDWYEKSGEAVNFIIENEYANAERMVLPVFDARRYEEDQKSNIIYW